MTMPEQRAALRRVACQIDHHGGALDDDPAAHDQPEREGDQAARPHHPGTRRRVRGLAMRAFRGVLYHRLAASAAVDQAHRHPSFDCRSAPAKPCVQGDAIAILIFPEMRRTENVSSCQITGMGLGRPIVRRRSNPRRLSSRVFLFRGTGTYGSGDLTLERGAVPAGGQASLFARSASLAAGESGSALNRRRLA